MNNKKGIPWKVLLKPGILCYIGGYILFLLVYIYFALPFFNLRDESFFILFIFMMMLPLSLIWLLYQKRKQLLNEGYEYKGITYDKNTKKVVFTQVNASEHFASYRLIVTSTLVCILGGFILLGVLKLTGLKIFNATAYSEQLEIEIATTADLNKTFDYEEGEVKLPTIDKDLAAKLAQAKLEEYGAQYSIDVDNFTIISVERNGGTDLVRVTPLEYSNVFVSLSRMKKGTIGYIEVNVVTKEATLVKFDENNGLKYMPSGVFNYDLDRHVRSKYPQDMYNNKYFEIDNDGNPYWVIPTIKKEIGVFDGETPDGVILVDPITGATKKYALGEQPSWVQRCVDEKVMEKQANNALSLKNGFWNVYFSKKEVFQLSDGYNYLLKDNATYYISCITSPNENDQTSIGFLIINLKTKEAIRYSCPGITEMRAREIAMYDERVKAQDLDSTWPILVSYHGVPTFFVVLKNDVQAQKIVFVNVENGQNVGMGNDIVQAKTEYDSLLSQDGVVPKEEKTASGIVTAIRDTGTTIEFMLDTLDNIYFVVDVNLSLDARFLKVGDVVDVVYFEYTNYNLVDTIKKE